ncbi:hypothetical protein CH06BL_14970 [Chromobacterium haemolyticum]|nr:hypothetical protein CH06BL_14970 [Chromobacterium haemolyticum]
MVRHSLNYMLWKRRPEVTSDLKRIYQSSTLDEAEQRLAEFEAKWDGEYLLIGQSWRRNWTGLTPFFDVPPEIRKVIYTTNTYAMSAGYKHFSAVKHRVIDEIRHAIRAIRYNVDNKHNRPIIDIADSSASGQSCQ